MDELSLFCMTATLFKRVENDDEVYYVPYIISNCFIKVVKMIKFKNEGLEPKYNEHSIAVIPFSSLSSIDEVSPNESEPPNLYGGLDTINTDDFIAKGTFESRFYQLKELSSLIDGMCIKYISRNDYSSIPCYTLKGE